MAKELHPDKNKNDPEASQKFQDLGAAYEVLSNPEKRQLYDRCGEECVKKEGGMSGGDPFSSFFGDFAFHFGGESHNQQESPRGANIVMPLYVTLEELYSSSFIEVRKFYIFHLRPIPKHRSLYLKIQKDVTPSWSLHRWNGTKTDYFLYRNTKFACSVCRR